jgi:hypothetical protein
LGNLSNSTFVSTEEKDRTEIDTTHIESCNVGSVNFFRLSINKMDALFGRRWFNPLNFEVVLLLNRLCCCA